MQIFINSLHAELDELMLTHILNQRENSERNALHTNLSLLGTEQFSHCLHCFIIFVFKALSHCLNDFLSFPPFFFCQFNLKLHQELRVCLFLFRSICFHDNDKRFCYIIKKHDSNRANYVFNIGLECFATCLNWLLLFPLLDVKFNCLYPRGSWEQVFSCLLYTSHAADELMRV